LPYFDKESDEVIIPNLDLSFDSFEVGDDIPYFTFRIGGEVLLASEAGITVKAVSDPRPNSRGNIAAKITFPESLRGGAGSKMDLIVQNGGKSTSGVNLPNIHGFVPVGKYQVTWYEKIEANGIGPITTAQWQENSSLRRGVNGGFIGGAVFYGRTPGYSLVKTSVFDIIENDKFVSERGGDAIKGFGDTPAVRWNLFNGNNAGADGYSIFLDDMKLILQPTNK